MKPEDLDYPFVNEPKRVMIADRIWYIPQNTEHSDPFEFSSWESPEFFGNQLPIKIEYCSGNGTWIAEKARLDPHSNWLGVEMKFSRIRKIWSKIRNYKLPNLMGLCGEAYCSTKKYFPTQSVSEIYINFPDPWPKRRHANHRLFQAPFIEELSRILVKEGKVFIVTDDAKYSSEIITRFHQALNPTTKQPLFQSTYPAPYFLTEFPNYGSSFFDDLWRNKGKQIHYHLFQKM